MRKTYTGFIIELEANQIFIFGSNPQGKHGMGTALLARQKFGAIYGQGYGRQGQSYGIVTKDLMKKKHPSISKEEIIEQIIELYKYANKNPELEFYIAYTGSGKNLNGYTPNEMAKMFWLDVIPINIIFEQNFYELIQKN